MSGFLWVLITVFFNTCAQVFLKVATASTRDGFAQILVEPKFYLYALFQGVGIVTWIMALRAISLHMAFAGLALMYLTIPLACKLFLGEQIFTLGYLGFALIIVGVGLVGLQNL